MLDENNERSALVQVLDSQEKILYMSGEPRFEVKFIRRAVEDDENIRVVLLQRLAVNKFQRLAIEDADELFGGFPKTREELFQYRGLILGSVEASFFTADQQRMIVDFVSQRGGGLLTLGARHSYDRGGWAGTPVAEVLPVVLGDAAAGGDASFEFTEINVEPTLFGRGHPVTQLGESTEESLERWSQLPPLGIVNRLSRTKPGAATLLEGRAAGLDEPQVVLAFQRYGSGRSIAFTAMDSWQWQMHYDIAVDDLTHETLWRQLLRWLVADVRGQVRADLERSRFSPGEPLEIRAEVLDDTYLAVNNAQVQARVVSPSGAEETLPLRWAVDVDGRYSGSFVPREVGVHAVSVEAVRSGAQIGVDTIYGEATEHSEEFFAAEMNRELLERISAETGGRFYTAESADELPGDLVFTQSGTTVTEVLDLWDMPIIFLALVTLMGSEWGFRKVRGLP